MEINERVKFETNRNYESDYDSYFNKTNVIAGLIEFINYFNNKIVSSNLESCHI